MWCSCHFWWGIDTAALTHVHQQHVCFSWAIHIPFSKPTYLRDGKSRKSIFQLYPVAWNRWPTRSFHQCALEFRRLCVELRIWHSAFSWLRLELNNISYIEIIEESLCCHTIHTNACMLYNRIHIRYNSDTNLYKYLTMQSHKWCEERCSHSVLILR